MNTRDIALAAVAAVSAIALGIVAFAAPGNTNAQTITGLVALGTIALGRISGANSTSAASTTDAPTEPIDI